VSYLRLFSTTAYVHIPVGLNLSKLYPQSVKTVFLGYFSRDRYKLLDREIGSTFHSHNVIFKEEITHFTTQPTHMDTINEDLFPITETILWQAEPKQESTKTDSKPQTDANVPQQMITLRPLLMTELHKETYDLRSNNLSLITNLGPGKNTPLAIWRMHRDPRPTSRLQDSLEYLSWLQAFLINTDNWIPSSYTDTMQCPDLWWEPMVREYEMLKEWRAFELTPQLLERNIVDSKWVYVVKWRDDGTVDRQKARTIAKGFTQVLDKDYNKTYTSVAQLESV